MLLKNVEESVDARERIRIEFNGDPKKRQLCVTPYRLNEDGEPRYMGLTRVASWKWLETVPDRELPPGTGTYNCGLTEYFARALYTYWDESQIEWQSEELRQEVRLTLIASSKLDQVMELIAEWRALPEDIKNKPDCLEQLAALKVHDDPSLRATAHQVLGALAALKIPGYGLAFEQGVGKTLSTIVRIMNDKPRHGSIYRAVIVVPPALRVNWERELNRFATKKIHVLNLRGDATERVFRLLEGLKLAKTQKAEVFCLIISYDIMVAMIEELKMIPWDLAVCDESQWIKDPTTARAKAAHELRDAAISRMCLSGTPVGNHALDLYSQFEFLEKGASGHTTWQSFRKAHGVYVRTGTGIDALVEVTNTEELRERVARRWMVVRKNEVLKGLPEKTFDLIETDMCPAAWKSYREMRDFLVAEVEEMVERAAHSGGGVTRATVNNALTKLLRLAQITNGFLRTDDILNEETGEVLQKGEIKYFDPNLRIKTLLEVVEQLPGNEKGIIWNYWVPSAEMIKTEMLGSGWKLAVFEGSDQQRQDAVDRFNRDPSCRWLLANPQSAGAGLNLLGHDPAEPHKYDTDCTWHISYSYNWSFLQWAQAQDRSHRRGSRKPLRVSRIVVPNTIDVEIHDRIMAKKMGAEMVTDVSSILDALRRI